MCNSAVSLSHAKLSGSNASFLDAFDPRARFFCAFALSVVYSFIRSPASLLLSAVLPLLLFFAGDRAPLLSALRRVNAAGFLICLLLPLTYAGERTWGIFSVDGMLLGLLVMVRLNLITITMQRLVVSLGMGRVHNVLLGLRVPEKFRILLLLTMRHISILADRVLMMRRAVSVRGPRLRWQLASYVFACGVGSAMIHSHDRAARSLLAIHCRGGFGGFAQGGRDIWRVRDTFLCILCALYICAVLAAIWSGGASHAGPS